MTQALTLPAPAKLNLFLHINGRRSDGYHQLQTVFQLLDAGDDLSFTLGGDDILCAREWPELPWEHNLIYRAAILLRQRAGKSLPGVTVDVVKRLPQGGGLGGGSSNAATTLLALNHLWNLDLSLDELADIGRRLGADVPVFVRGHSAWAEGVGEQLTAIDLPERWYLILHPNCHVSTAQIFAHKDLTRDSALITVAAFLEGGGKNDCQTLVSSLFPQVKNAIDWLNQFGEARLTGTGACVFTAFETAADAHKALSLVPEIFSGFVARGVNISPLHQSLPETKHWGVAKR